MLMITSSQHDGEERHGGFGGGESGVVRNW
jgi:hypothetical protein